MSTVPPNTPPGGPYPPQDAKAQYRAWREQQKNAYRTQRQYWREQRRAMRGAAPRSPSIVGPVALILAGVAVLLIVSGHLAAGRFWSWYGRWWPLLLIAAGLALLAEWFYDARRARPTHRGGGFVTLLLILAVVGLGAAGWSRFAYSWGGADRDGEFFNSLGGDERHADQPAIVQEIPANAVIHVQLPRGDVNISGLRDGRIEAQAHQVAYANSDREGQKILDAGKVRVVVNGSSVLVQVDEVANGRTNLNLAVPAGAHVLVTAARGDVQASGLRAGVEISAPRGDVRLNAVAGTVQVHLANGEHDFSARQIEGDVLIDGNASQMAFSEIRGRIWFKGEIFGGAHGENIAGPISLRTSVTQMELGELPGDFNLNTEILQINHARGHARIVTHSKDVELSRIEGESAVEDRNGHIAVALAGAYSTTIKNTKGDVELALPPNLSATVELRTRNGEIFSELPLPNQGRGQERSISLRLGSGGGALVSASAENGDIRLKRGALPVEEERPEPPALSRRAPLAPLARPARPAAPAQPRLRAPGTEGSPFVTQ